VYGTVGGIVVLKLDVIKVRYIFQAAVVIVCLASVQRTVVENDVLTVLLGPILEVDKIIMMDIVLLVSNKCFQMMNEVR
jgi:hypothetical protein